jgi:hypothetical protein
MKKKLLKPILPSLLVLIVYLPFLAATTGGQYSGPVPEYSRGVNGFAFDLLKREAANGSRGGSRGWR